MKDAFGFVWTGEVMRPIHKQRIGERFEVGHIYFLDEVAETSERSMRHEFAWLRTAWANLPEEIAKSYPTPEHLRKRALIETGFYDETAVDCGSNHIALRVAASFTDDDFALIMVDGQFVLKRKAKSQSRRAMKREDFQRSKDAIMNLIADMIGVDPFELSQW